MVLSKKNQSQIIRSHNLDIRWNLSAEEYLLETVSQGKPILFLWQSEDAVVIGKNQNLWKECPNVLIEKDQVSFARRISGGGAVFHDVGNLNYSFIAHRQDYDLDKQIKVIRKALNKIGLHFQMDSHYALTINKLKISGNAFRFSKHKALHHGTLLVSSNLEKLNYFLQNSLHDISSKGVKSRPAEVTNLSLINESITVNSLNTLIANSFCEEYGLSDCSIKEFPANNYNQFKHIYEKHQSWEWLYGRTPQFEMTLNPSFEWGSVKIVFFIKNGLVSQSQIESEVLSIWISKKISDVLNGLQFDSKKLSEALNQIKSLDLKMSDLIRFMDRTLF